MNVAQSSTWGSTERRVALGSFGGATALIVVFLLRDASAFVNSANDELLGHVGASIGFTVAATGTLLVRRGSRPALLTMLLMGAAITIAAELAQGLAPSRGVQLRDVAFGFAGVLLAGVAIEFIFNRSSLLRALRAHTGAAIAIALVLATMLVFDLRPRTISDAVPDGETCPLTAVTGVGQRVVLGDELVVADNCVTTTTGGFGVFGPEGATTVGDETVLVSSPLGELVQAIDDTRRLTVRAQFMIDEFDEDEENLDPPGVIALLRSVEAGEVLQVRTRHGRTEIYGPTTDSVLRAVAFSQVLEPNTTYMIEIELAEDTLTVRLDGAVISELVVGDGWIPALAEFNADEDLTLYLGNHYNRKLPFNGVIEWVEIEAGDQPG